MKDINNTIEKKLGDLGQNFVKSFFTTHEVPFREGTKEEDLKYGIDCYIGNKEFPTDVKNTRDIYFCQIFTDSETINTRHPFKAHSKATHYCVVSVSETEKKFIELVEIEERLIRDFFINKNYFTEFKLFLQSLDQKGIYTEGLLVDSKPLHIDQACIQLKNRIKIFLKPNVYIKYPTITPETKEISFRLTLGKEEDVIKKQVKEEELVKKTEISFQIEKPTQGSIIIKV